MHRALTLEETFELLGIPPQTSPLCKDRAKEILPRTTDELDWAYARVDVRERSTGVPELTISIPFKVKGL